MPSLQTRCFRFFLLFCIHNVSAFSILHYTYFRMPDSTRYGGDSSAVKDQLWHVKHVCVGDGASAAVREDGTVITWGDDSEGGDSSKVGFFEIGSNCQSDTCHN